MSALEDIGSVKSFRKCRDETIPRKVVGRILESGRNTPSPGGVNSLEFIVVEDQSSLDTLGDMTGDSRISESSVSIVIVGDLERMERKVGSDSFNFSFAEVSVAAQNMRIEAASHDLCSIWVSGYDYDILKEELSVPDGKLPLAVVGFGYSDDPVELGSRWGMNEICFYESYGNQVGSNFEGFEWSGVREERRIYGKKIRGLYDILVRKIRKVL